METPYQWWMDRLLRVAAKAGQRGEVPVAAVLLDPRGRAIGWGSNRREGAQDPFGACRTGSPQPSQRPAP